MPALINSDDGVVSGTSGLKTTGANDGILALQTNGSTAMTVNASQQVTFNNGANLPNTFGFKNRLINGGMTVWQRGTSFSGVTPSLGVAAYTADRWYVAQLTFQSATDVSQQTTGNTRFAIRVQKRSGSTGASTNIIGQVIENLNCLDLPSQPLALSFTARAGANYSATSSNLLVQIFTCTAADQSAQNFINGSATGQATLLSQNVTLTTSNQRFTITTSAVASNATNICLQFSELSSASAAGANDWFEISDVQLERGSTATSFDFRSIGTELALCQRYFEVSYFDNSGYFFVSTARSSFTDQWAWYYYQVAKRTTPTVTLGSGTWFGTTPGIVPGLSWTYAQSGSATFYRGGTAGTVAASYSSEL